MVTVYYFPLGHTLLSLSHSFTHNLVIVYFGRIIINIMEEKERRVLFLEENLNTCQAYGMGRLVSSNKLLPQTTKI